MQHVFSKEHMRRKLERYSKFNISGLYKCHTLENILFIESYNELSTYYVLDNDPTIIRMESQPISIAYFFDGKIHFYTPDVGVEQITQSGVIAKYIEVKHSSALEDPKTKRKLKVIKSEFEKRGYHFEIRTEKSIPGKEFLFNLQLFHKGAANVDSQSPLIDDALLFLPRQITLGEATAALQALRIDISVLSYLLLKQLYKCDMSKLIHRDTELFSNLH